MNFQAIIRTRPTVNFWLRAAWLALLGVAVRAPALRGELIWDDNELIANNPLIKSPLFVAEAFRHYLFPGAYSGHYRPVQTLSYILDYWWWNTDTFGFHLTNVALHVLGGVLLFALLRRIFADFSWPRTSSLLAPENVAWLIAVLWVVHPVHSAAVDYLSGRADSLAFCFGCGAWLLYLRGAAATSGHGRRVGYFIFTAMLALLAFCSRESGGLWLLIFLAHRLVFSRSASTKRKVVTVAGCLGIALIYLSLRALPEHRAEPPAAITLTAVTRGVLMLRATGDYAGLMVFPSRLLIERTVLTAATAAHPERWQALLFADQLAFVGAALLAVFIWGVMRKTPGRPMRILGAGWFVITYLPTSNLVAINATVAEHWLYLPSVGFLVFIAGCIVDLPAHWSRAIAFAACAAVLGLSVRSAVRSSDWVNSETFFRRTFAAGGSSSRIGVNLGVSYAQRGEHAKAEAILRKVLAVTPNYPLARSNLILALNQQGKTAEAAVMADEPREHSSEKMKPSGYRPTSDAALNRAKLRHAAGDDDAALASLDRGLRDFPDTWPLIQLRAQILGQRQGIPFATRILQDFADQHWWHFGAAMALARLHAQVGDTAAGIDEFERASHLDVHDAEALNALAYFAAERGELDRACVLQARAAARQPHQPQQFLLLAELLQKAGRTAEAKEMLEQSRLAAN